MYNILLYKRTKQKINLPRRKEDKNNFVKDISEKEIDFAVHQDIFISF